MHVVTEEDVRQAIEAEETQDPAFTAREILDKIAESGGRIYRGKELVVFCLTQDRDVLRWLLLLGGKFHAGSRDGYRRTSEGPVEWDIYLHLIPVRGDETMWEAAAPYLGGKR